MSLTSLRFALPVSFAGAALLAIVAVVSCGDESLSRELDPTSDAAPSVMPIDAQATDGQSTPTTTMRFAHLAPSFGPVDFCYQGAKKGTFVGPVLRGGPPSPDPKDHEDDAGDGGNADTQDGGEEPSDADADAGVDAGTETLRSASYRTLSRYQTLQAAGPITIAIVAAGATSCGNSLVEVNVTLDPGKLSTVALFERPADGGLTLDVSAYTDDRTTGVGEVRARVIHAALGKGSIPSAGPLAVRAVAAKTTVLADRVEPKRAATASPVVLVDGLGYVTAAPIPPPTSFAIGPAESGDASFEGWLSEARDLDLRGGSLHTAFILTGASESTFEVLWCSDTTTAGDQTMCTIVTDGK
jgi:hypothetical protein